MHPRLILAVTVAFPHVAALARGSSGLRRF
jgi:hypothetical protein